MRKEHDMRTGMIVFCTAVFLICGCAELPKPMTFPLTTQTQLQSATHWQVIAKGNAQRVNSVLIDQGYVKPDGSEPIIFIANNDNSSFGVAYREYLITELKLINPRVRISDIPGVPIHVRADTQMVYRNPDRLKPEGLIEGVAEFTWELLTGSRWTTRGPLVSHAELILTTRVMVYGAQGHHPVELARYSDTFYVNDGDMYNYNYGAGQDRNYWKSIAGQDEAWKNRLAQQGWITK
jgi:hypothetical protein